MHFIARLVGDHERELAGYLKTVCIKNSIQVVVDAKHKRSLNLPSALARQGVRNTVVLGRCRRYEPDSVLDDRTEDFRILGQVVVRRKALFVVVECAFLTGLMSFGSESPSALGM